jgi:hypothetical protein
MNTPPEEAFFVVKQRLIAAQMAVDFHCRFCKEGKMIFKRTLVSARQLHLHECNNHQCRVNILLENISPVGLNSGQETKTAAVIDNILHRLLDRISAVEIEIAAEKQENTAIAIHNLIGEAENHLKYFETIPYLKCLFRDLVNAATESQYAFLSIKMNYLREHLNNLKAA